ncbi:c-Myc-binding protein [Nilaparvata lugens]|uniref:c-Myc-binding protein n=1 Tax=Nilaparvata lugens TaxID=108931 RepID=UPI000B97FDBC|nr:c-Myc-binding protein [Nilaparvata lugens]
MSSITGVCRPIDSKREEFRKYLESSGVMDAMTNALVMLYEEADKPSDALGYVIKQLCSERAENAELEMLRQGVESLRIKVQTLEEQRSNLKQRLEIYEPCDQEESVEKDGNENIQLTTS